MNKRYWHKFNPWKDEVVYVTLEELADCYYGLNKPCTDAADFCLTDLFSLAQDYVNDMGYESAANLEDRLRAIQYSAIHMIVSIIVEAYEANGKKR